MVDRQTQQMSDTSSDYMGERFDNGLGIHEQLKLEGYVEDDPLIAHDDLMERIGDRLFPIQCQEPYTKVYGVSGS